MLLLTNKMPDGMEQPIGYTSRTLSESEYYSQLKKEALACVFGVRQIHLYLFGYHFELYTDNQPLLAS